MGHPAFAAGKWENRGLMEDRAFPCLKIETWGVGRSLSEVSHTFRKKREMDGALGIWGEEAVAD